MMYLSELRKRRRRRRRSLRKRRSRLRTRKGLMEEETKIGDKCEMAKDG